MALNTGDVFESFQQFEVTLKTFQSANNVLFTRKSSRKFLLHPDSERLQYEFVHYECKQGKKRATASKGLRPNQRSLKCDCDAYIRISTFEMNGRTALKITGANHNHTNHLVDAKTASVYPENRKPIITDTVRALATGNVHNKKLRQYLQDSQGICVRPQDVSNLKRKLRDGTGADATESEAEAIDRLLLSVRKEGGSTTFGVGENNEFKYLFIVSAAMKRNLNHSMDVFVLDVIYTVNRYLYPLVTVMCIDNDGVGRPVVQGFVTYENDENLLSCLSFLKSFIPEGVFGPSIFFVDKNLSGIDAVRETFPGAMVQLCSFHALTTVKRALVRHGLPSRQVQTFLEYFKEQRDTDSEARFYALANIIREEAPDQTVQYFYKNWWGINELWAHHDILDTRPFHAMAIKHVESYYSKIKRTLHPQSQLLDCIATLLRFGTDQVGIEESSTLLWDNAHVKHDGDIVIELLRFSLTSFASELVIDQYQIAKQIRYFHKPTGLSSPETTTHTHQDGGERDHINPYTTTASDCNCSFFTKFQLPCLHIFSLRHFLGLSRYSSKMFTGSQYLRSRQFLSDDTIPPGETEPVPYESEAKTQEGRYRIVSALSNKINSLFKSMGDEEFNLRMGQLERFVSLVCAGKDVAIVEGTETSSIDKCVATSAQSIGTKHQKIDTSSSTGDSLAVVS